MARKQDKKVGIVGRIVRAAFGRILSPIFGERDEDKERIEKSRSRRAKKVQSKQRARTRVPRETAGFPVSGERHPTPRRGAVVDPIELSERRGAARDEVSFEQRRRGGPVTGEAPGKTHGPRHAGGSKRRGRDETADEILDSMTRLPIPDYENLTAEQIEDRLEGLRPRDIETLLRFEKANKFRKSVVTLLERRLAA